MVYSRLLLIQSKRFWSHVTSRSTSSSYRGEICSRSSLFAPNGCQTDSLDAAESSSLLARSLTIFSILLLFFTSSERRFLTNDLN